jgi:hypothetical protein
MQRTGGGISLTRGMQSFGKQYGSAGVGECAR